MKTGSSEEPIGRLALLMQLESVATIEIGYWLDGLGCDGYRNETVWCYDHGWRAARLLTQFAYGPLKEGERNHRDRNLRWDAALCWAGDDEMRRCHFCHIALETGGIVSPDAWWRLLEDEEFTPDAAELLVVAKSMTPDSSWWPRWCKMATKIIDKPSSKISLSAEQP